MIIPASRNPYGHLKGILNGIPVYRIPYIQTIKDDVWADLRNFSWIEKNTSAWSMATKMATPTLTRVSMGIHILQNDLAKVKVVEFDLRILM